MSLGQMSVEVTWLSRLDRVAVDTEDAVRTLGVRSWRLDVLIPSWNVFRHFLNWRRLWRSLNRLLRLHHLLLLWDHLSLLLLLLMVKAVGSARGLWILRGHGGDTLSVSRWTGRH